MITKNFFKDLDTIGSIILISSSVLLLLFLIITSKRPVYILLGFFMLFTGIIWLYLRKKAIIMFNSSYTQYIFLNIIFFISLIFSIIIIYFRPDDYVRPLSYFVITSFIAGIVALEIFFSPSKKYNILILFQIIILGLSISLSQLLLFPTVIGIDPWWHETFTSLIISSHHIPNQGYAYEKLPIFHLLIGNTSIITGLNYKLSSIMSVTLPLVIISVLIIYSMGKRLINDKIGLLGSLILVLSNYVINGEIWSIPTTLGGVFLLIIIYILLNFYDKKIISSILALSLMFILILTHTIVSLEMAIILLTGWLSLVIYSYLYKKSKNYFSLTVTLVFTVTMLGWWIYASGTFTTIMNIISWGLNIDPSLISTPQTVMSYLSTISLNQQIFINLGTFILFSLSVLGVFFLISERYSNEKKFLYGFIAITPLLISFISILSGHSIIEGRWIFIAEILLSIPSAIAIIILLNQFSSNKSKIGLLFGMIFILSFLMILNSNVANIDNDQFYSDGAVRYAITNSELISFERISTFNSSIKTDDYYLYANSSLILSQIKKGHSISDNLYTDNFTNITNSMLLLRNEIEKNPFTLYGTTYKLNYDVEKTLNQNKFSVLYDSGSVKGYYKF